MQKSARAQPDDYLAGINEDDEADKSMNSLQDLSEESLTNDKADREESDDSSNDSMNTDEDFDENEMNDSE